MVDLLNILDKEKKLETKIFKVERQFESDYDAYRKVVFEENALRRDNDKIVLNYQDSLDDLIQRGYERHPRPNEVFSLLCAYLEGERSLKSIAEDMLSSYGEWFSLAMKHQNNILHCYIDPELELDRNNLQYHLKSCTSEIHFGFPVSDKYWFKIQEVNNLNPEIVEFLWSRPFDKLPLGIRNGAYLYVSENIWPVGRGNCGSGYYVYCFYDWASRGVQKNAK